MRYDPKKSFGYPVLRQFSDDYLDASIIASVDLIPSDDGQSGSFVADYTIMIGVPELRQALRDGDVSAIITLFCPKTYFLDTIITQELRGSKVIDLSGVRGDLLITMELVVKNESYTLRSSKIHPEFGGLSAEFSLHKGDVVAQAEPMKIYIERELFKPVLSLFKWIPDENVEMGQWSLDLNGEYAGIIISPEQLNLLAIKQKSPEGQALLTNSIFLPAMAQMIDEAINDIDNESLWMKTISQKLADLGVDISKDKEVDSIDLAQRILQFPLRSLNVHYMHED